MFYEPVILNDEIIEYLKTLFKFNDSILQILNKKYKKKQYLKKVFIKLSKFYKPSISNDTILLFYSDPKIFFENNATLLNDTSYFDELGTSIFEHYFYVLYTKFIEENNNRLNSRNDIYSSNFSSFFKTHAKYITIQDFHLDTPLHKIAKKRNKKFFITYYKLLKDIDVANEQMLSIKNINNESCFDYVVDEIELNINKFTKKDIEIYLDFLKINKTNIELLSPEKQRNIKLFLLSINFHLKPYKHISFNEIYIGINNLLKEVKGKIIEYNYFFNENKNILNISYHLCKTDVDFNKMFKLITELLNPNLKKFNKLGEIIKMNKDEISLEYYIYNHIAYVLRKMKKNEKSEIYGLKLINEIIPLLLNDDLFDEIKDKEKVIKLIKLKFNINSPVVNIAKNPNLNFEQKCEILNMLKEILNEHFNKDTDEDVVYLYKLFKLYNVKYNNKKKLNELSITSYFKKCEYVRKIFSDFFFIGKIYRKIYFLCKQYDNINLSNYMKDLNNFILKNKEIFEHYKNSYSMNDKNIEIIKKIIILFEKQNYNTGIEEEYLPRKIIKLNNKNKLKYEKFLKKFILSIPKLTFYYIKDIISNSQRANKKLRIKLYSDFLDIFFTFKYDFDKLAANKSIISYFSNNKCIEEINNYHKKLKENLSIINNDKNVFSIYKFILKYSPHIKNIYIFNTNISRYKILMKKYLYLLLFKWNEDCDFKELSDLIKENIVPFCKLFIDVKDTIEDRKNKINFFFDEFINELDPAFKNEQYQRYKRLALNYLNFSQDIEDNYFYQLDYKIYFPMMLIFIRLKYGKYNPDVLYAYVLENKSNNNFFLLFLKSYFYEEYKNNIPNHFLLFESNLYSTFPDKYKIQYNKFCGVLYFPKISFGKYHELIINYFAFISSKLKHIEFSLIFDYIKSILNILISEDEEYRDTFHVFNQLFKYIFSAINKEQNEDIFNSSFDVIFKGKINKGFFYFLDIDTVFYTEENIKHKLKIISQISLYLNESKIENLSENIYYEWIDRQKYENIIKILKVLKNENNSFFNCVKNNNCLLKISFRFLWKIYFFDIFQELDKNKKDFPSENKDSLLLKEEIYKFFDFYRDNVEYIKDHSKDLSDIFFYDTSSLYRLLSLNICSLEMQLLYNYKNVNISFFKSIFSNDFIILLLYYKYIIIPKNSQSKKEENKSKESSNKNTEKISENNNEKNSENNNEKSSENSNESENDYNITNDEIVLLLLENYQFLINKDAKIKYEKYLSFFNELKTYYSESDRENFMNKNESDNIYLILVLLYANQIYPSYNPSLLYYTFKKYFMKAPKKFFISFLNCIKDKQNQKNIPIHLFLEKDENIQNKKNKIDITNLDKDSDYAKIVLKKYIAKYLVNLNYSENSLFFEFIEYKIKKALLKNNLKKIDYIIFYYSHDKNEEFYQIICEQFIKLKIPFYYFLDYDSDINNEQNMIKIIQLLENLSKNTIINKNKNSEDIENEVEELNEYKNKRKESKNEDDYFKKIKSKKIFFLYHSELKPKEIEKLKKRISKAKYEKQRRERYFRIHLPTENKYNNAINKIKNLYTFFRVLKEQNKNLIDIIQGNDTFLIETIDILLYSIIYTSSAIYQSEYIKEIQNKNKTETMNEQIYEFFRALFINNKNNDILEKYFQNLIIREKKVHVIKLFYFFEKYFIKKIKNINSEKIPDNEYQPYKEIITKICLNYFDSISSRNTFIILFEKDINKFIDFLNIGIFDPLYSSKIFISLMHKNFQKFLTYPELFSFISSNKMNSQSYIRLNNNIVKYILNHTEEEKYYNIDFINDSYIFKDLNLSLYCLNDIYKEKALFFVVNRIQKLFGEINTNVKLFLEIIKRQINNDYVFDYLFKSFNENELIELYKDNKNIIIISLYKYSEINAVKYIQRTFNNLNKFMPENELKKILCQNIHDNGNENENDFPDYIIQFLEDSKKVKLLIKEKSEKDFDNDDKNSRKFIKKKMKKIIEDIIEKVIIEKNQKKYEPKKDINRYLIFYALINPKIINYETVAYLLEQIPIESSYLCLIEFLSFDMSELFNIKIMKFLDYITKNKRKIKSIGNNLYNTLEFFEKLSKVLNDAWKNLSNIEKNIFYYYMIIIIFQVTPKKLISFLDLFDKKNSSINISLSEQNLFIILAFYEIKGESILPIQKYLPKFYFKIENLYQKFEYLNIPKLNLKSDFDIKFLTKYKNLLENQTEKYIESLSYFSYKNYILIIQKEFAPNIELISDNFEIIDKLILDLIEKDDILPFYKCDKIDEFCSNLKLLDYKIRGEKRYEIIEDLSRKYNSYIKRSEKIKEELEKFDINENINNIIYYKSIIYSLLNFNETSSQILQNNNNLIKKYKWENDTPLRIYLNYLETIKEIYLAITKKNEKNEYDFYNINVLEEYNISEKVEIRLKTMKSNINLNKIISEVIKAYEKIEMNQNKFFDKIVKWINNFINSNNEEMKEIKKIFGEKLNIFSYFKYLVANCNIIIRATETFNKIKEIQKYSIFQENIEKYYYSNKYLLKLKIDFDFSENKEISRKNSGESLFNLGEELVERINEGSTNLENNYKVYFYFNEKEEKFCETCSDIDLIEFIQKKFLAIFEFYNEIIKNYHQFNNERINDLLYINNKLNEKDIYSLFLDYMLLYNIDIKEEEKKKEIFNIFNPFMEENQNLIASYFKKTSDKCNQPNYHDCLCLIKYKMDEIAFNLFEPCLSLNIKLNYYSFSDRRNTKFGHYFHYNNYIINLEEIINSIRKINFHLDSKLNSLFQIKAINYIINDNSNFSLFIFELYKALLKKKEKNFIEFEKNEESIEEKFIIKIVKGKKYTKDDFDILKKKKDEIEKEKNEKEKEKEKKEIKKRQLNHNEKVQYKLCKYDTDDQYNNNYFPFKSIYYNKGEKLKNQEYKTFDDYIINFKGKKKKYNYVNKNNFINVYDLIFTVKNIDKNNIITLEQNDISEILANYSDKETFNSLLNQNFSYKTDEELNVDITPIKLYLKGKKFM